MCYHLKVAYDSTYAITHCMLIVVDTNVIWQAFHHAHGPSGFILELVVDEKIQLALSQSVFTEYTDVLFRPSSIERFDSDPEDIRLNIDALAGLAIWQKIWFNFRPNLRDEADNMFVELAIASGADFLITNNVGDFTRQSDLKFDDLNVIQPKQFALLWRIINE